MKNRKILISSMAIVFAFSLVSCQGGFPPTPHNKSFDKEINEAVIHLVEQVIDVQYKTHNKELLRTLFTDELLEKNLEKYNDYYHVFFKDVPFRYSKDYMKSLRNTDDNQWSVIIRMHEGGLISERSFWLYITIIKTEDGSYKISSYERNA